MTKAEKGSQYWLQAIINDAGSRERLAECIGLGEILWLSPLESENYREYQLKDEQVLEDLSLSKELFSFWPANGPIWDAIGLTADKKTIVLVEAKAHIGEMKTSARATDPESVDLIEQSMRDAFAAYPGGDFEAWKNKYYQLGNRLTFLHKLNGYRAKTGKDVVLVLLNFVGDRTNIPTSYAEWESHYAGVFAEITGIEHAPEDVRVVYCDPYATLPTIPVEAVHAAHNAIGDVTPADIQSPAYADANTSPNAPAPDYSKKNNKKKWILIGSIAAAIAVALVAVFIVLPAIQQSPPPQENVANVDEEPVTLVEEDVVATDEGIVAADEDEPIGEPFMENPIADEDVEETSEDEATYDDAEEDETVAVYSAPMVTDIEGEVLAVRAIWNAAMKEKGSLTVKKPRKGVKTYSDGSDVVLIEVTAGTDGSKYSRTYNFENGELRFAYIEGDDAHRLYFKDDQLFRWRYTPDKSKNKDFVDHEYDFSSPEYMSWEQFALGEAYDLINS
jgi:hypothetical protein